MKSFGFNEIRNSESFDRDFLTASSNQIINLGPFQEANVHIVKNTNPAGTDCSIEVKVEWTLETD